MADDDDDDDVDDEAADTDDDAKLRLKILGRAASAHGIGLKRKDRMRRQQ